MIFASTSARGISRSSSRLRQVTPNPLMPQGVMRSNQERSVFTFRAKPWEVIQPDENFTPMAAILFSPTHTPVYCGWCEHPDENLFEFAEVGVGVARLEA